MITKNKTAIVVSCFLLAALAVCDAKEPTNPLISSTPSPYPVLDSGVWADWSSYIPIFYWIDNNRIIFKTVKDNDKNRISSGPFNLSIWDIGKRVKPYTDYYSSVTVCVSGDIIHRTQTEANGNVRRFYGKFGEEKSFEFPKIKGAFFDDMNCRPIDNPEIIEKRKTRHIKLLLDRHGYLDFGSLQESSTSKEFITLYRAGNKQGISVPIQAQWINQLRYFQFKDAYMLYGIKGGNQFWWLYPDGKVEKVAPSSGFGFPTRKGLVGGWGKAKSNMDPGTVGVYFWSDKESIKLIAGYAAKGIAVSPDGCKLAFIHYPYLDATKIKDPGRITLKMINVCMEEKSHGQ